MNGASASPPETAETTIPQGVPCTRLANVMLAPKEEAHRIAAYVPQWGAQLTANWSESKAWATYRMLQKNTRCSSAIANRSYCAVTPGLPAPRATKSAFLTTTEVIWINFAASSSLPVALA